MTDRQTTHAQGCWSWGPKHYECALKEIEALRKEVERLSRYYKNESVRAGEEAVRKMFGGDDVR